MDISKVRKKLKTLKAEEEEKKPDSAEVEDVSSDADTEKAEEAPRESTPEKNNEAVSVPSKPAAALKEEDGPVENIELIAFSVSNEEFAVRLTDMQEIMRLQIVTPMPRSPRYLEGVTFLRGKVLPVINLKERLSLDKGNVEKQKIIVMLTSKNPVGILTDKIIEVIRIPQTDLLQPPSTLTDKEKGFIEGVLKIGDRFISVLNINKIVEMEK